MTELPLQHPLPKSAPGYFYKIYTPLSSPSSTLYRYTRLYSQLGSLVRNRKGTESKNQLNTAFYKISTCPLLHILLLPLLSNSSFSTSIHTYCCSFLFPSLIRLLFAKFAKNYFHSALVLELQDEDGIGYGDDDNDDTGIRVSSLSSSP